MFAGRNAVVSVVEEASFAAVVLRGLAIATRSVQNRTGFWTVVLALLLASMHANADALDAVPLDTRAQLAVAASVYPPGEAPALDPGSSSFAPNTVSSYLETNEDGHYSAGILQNGMQLYFTLARFADDKEAVSGIETWKASGEPTVPLDWGGSFAAFRRGQGLLGVSMLGGGIVARGQSGRWHFEVNVVPRNSGPGAETGSAEIGAAAEAMRTLAANAVRYRLFPRELVVEFQVAGSSRRLSPGQPFQLPLRAEEDTQASFSLQVLDGGKPVEAVNYQVTLSGALAAIAELEQNGARSPRNFAEASSPNGEPVILTWVFPPATAAALSGLIDKGDTSLALAVEARPAPKVLP